MMQARQLGNELYVGVHSDEDILHHKGPTVMRMDERETAVNACKWVTQVVPNAPYVTDPKFMDKYDCPYVAHGDDITTDANGNDCYQEVKDLGRFVVFKRTPNILTTDLVGRMLLMLKAHHYRPVVGDYKDHPLFSDDNLDRFQRYATDETGNHPGLAVWLYQANQPQLTEIVAPLAATKLKLSKIVYVDGGFDLFHPGHIEALRVVHDDAQKEGAAVVVGIHDDKTVSQFKGMNYPIMNLFERALCTLQCRFVDAIVLAAPYEPTKKYLATLPGEVVRVFHGPTPFEDGHPDPYADVAGLFKEIGPHKYDDMNTETIVKRVLENKAAYEERQRKKGWKAAHERDLEAQERDKHA
ncbi:adenylyltransferase/cytidyltransferase family protein [Kocuria palustris]|nr:adenylyltransferase/cytidyltransferase family protein [Kocuria palustris]